MANSKRKQSSRSAAQRDTPNRSASKVSSGNGKNGGPALVIGLGASAGGLEAFLSFFRVMAADSGSAFVLVPHLDPQHKTSLPEILGRATSMPVATVTQPTRLAPNHVYLPAPGETLAIRNGMLVPHAMKDRRAPIDEFFLSLAEGYGHRAVSIVLSGVGSDGTLGLKAVKEAEGLTMAQAADSALHAGMPRSAAATGLVDLVLPAEKMPEQLLAYARRIARLGDGQTQKAFQTELHDHLVSIYTLLRTKTGHDFSQYKESTLLRRIQRRMQILQLDKVTSYVERLRKDPAEVDHMFQDLLIGVTHFFRDKDAFKCLETKVVPKLFENRVDDQIRVWVPGCSTGEEAYSIAILLRDCMQKLEVAPKIQIFATDIDEKALEIARTGVYSETIARDVGPRRLKQLFTPRGNAFQVTKEIREMCIFSVHDLIRDPPFSRLDLVSCRNLLIYMNGQLQSRVLPLFHFALRPGRFLFLGPSENVTPHAKLFNVLDSKHRLFRAAAGVPPQLPALPFLGGERAAPARTLVTKVAAERALTGAVERTLLAGFMPAYVVVNSRHDLIYASAGTGRYLELPAGAPTTNVVDMARRGLRLELRSALIEATQNLRRVTRDDLVIGTDGGTQNIRLVVQPLTVNDDGGTFFLIVFEDIGKPAPPEKRSGRGSAVSESKLVQQLEADLRATQERLQTTIEELETSNEELKSSNEEFQSMNEELQSANEELETSREELQSVNEELETVNAELMSKIEGLDRANNDLKNLLESTQIATIFLNRQFRIKNFTPAVKEIFHLIESDIGRPITDIVTRLAYESLAEDANRVMQTLKPVERELQLSDGHGTFIMRMFPYRTTDNVIDGVVITFIDITERKALAEERALLGNVVASSADAIIALSLGGAITAWNAGAERLFGYTAKEAIGRRWRILFPPDRFEAQEAQLMRAQQDEAISQVDTVMVAQGDRTVPVSLTTSGAKDLSGRLIGVSLIARDISERKQAEERQRGLLAELNHRVKNTLATVLSIANQTLLNASSLDDFKVDFTGRIQALSLTQNLLTQSNWGGVRLQDLVAAESAPFVKPGSQGLSVSGPEINLTPKATLTLALVLHELATNAAKYGAWSQPAGRVSIGWSVETKGMTQVLRLHWTETGAPIVQIPTRRGFGRRMIEEGITYELSGTTELEFRPDGLHCVIEVPISEALAVGRQALSSS